VYVLACPDKTDNAVVYAGKQCQNDRSIGHCSATVPLQERLCSSSCWWQMGLTQGRTARIRQSLRAQRRGL
jgi:hypothetical protein